MCSSNQVMLFGAISVAWAATFGAFPFVYDVGQCDRACNLKFRGHMFPLDRGESMVKGYRIGIFGDNKTSIEKCACYDAAKHELGIVDRLYSPVEVGYPYIWRDERVCGTDGVIYTNAETARANGVKVANCGPCGRCSNAHDIGRFRSLGDGLIKAVSPCIVSYMLFSKLLDQYCMETNVGLSPKCAECWVEDHGCLFSHCFYECVLKVDIWYKAFAMNSDDSKSFTGRNSPEEKNSCLHCMETQCSKPYIDSCGANRRTAGVESDIERDVREICLHSDV